MSEGTVVLASIRAVCQTVFATLPAWVSRSFLRTFRHAALVDADAFVVAEIVTPSFGGRHDDQRHEEKTEELKKRKKVSFKSEF